MIAVIVRSLDCAVFVISPLRVAVLNKRKPPIYEHVAVVEIHTRHERIYLPSSSLIALIKLFYRLKMFCVKNTKTPFLIPLTEQYTQLKLRAYDVMDRLYFSRVVLYPG